MYTMMQDGKRIRYFVITTKLGTTYEKLMLYWNRLMTSLRKHFRKRGKTIDYVWVTELGEKNHMVHRHGFFTQYVDQQYLTRLWKKATDGDSKFTHISAFRSKKSAGYLTKYLTKAVTLAHFKEIKKAGMRAHRYAFSRKYPRLPKTPVIGKWTFTYMPQNRTLLRKSIDLYSDTLKIINDLRSVAHQDKQLLIRQAAGVSLNA